MLTLLGHRGLRFGVLCCPRALISFSFRRVELVPKGLSLAHALLGVGVVGTNFNEPVRIELVLKLCPLYMSVDAESSIMTAPTGRRSAVLIACGHYRLRLNVQFYHIW